MMRKIKILAAIILSGISAMAFGQKRDTITERLMQCLEDSTTTSSMMNCEVEAYKSWDKELNQYYQLLMNKLPAETRKTLLNAQKKWLEFRDQEFLLISSYYANKEGSMWMPVAASEKTKIVQDRALSLKAYYEGLKDPE